MIKPLVAAIQASLVAGCVKPIIRADETPPTPPEPFTPAALFSGAEFGDWWDFRDASTLYKDSAQEQPVAAKDDLVQVAPGRRGTIILEALASGNRPKWSDADAGISSELINHAILQSDFAVRDYPEKLTLVVIGGHNTLFGVGPRSMVYLSSVADAITAYSFGTCVALRKSSSTDDRSDVQFRNRNYSPGSLDSQTPSPIRLASILSYGTPGIGRVTSITPTGIATSIATPGSMARYDRIRVHLERALGIFSYARGALLIERELTEAELNQLAAYFGVVVG